MINGKQTPKIAVLSREEKHCVMSDKYNLNRVLTFLPKKILEKKY